MLKPRTGPEPLDQVQPKTAAGRRRWLILIHQLPPTPSNLRVRTWRRLQQLGAVAVKQSVYLLPDMAGTREDFEWLKVEIEGAGGEAAVYSADHLDPGGDAALIDHFRHASQQAYAGLASELRRMLRAGPSRKGGVDHRRRDLVRCRQQLAAIERVDFFGGAGRDRVVTLLADLEAAAPPAARGKSRGKSRTGAAAEPGGREEYDGRLWVTRPRPGVDRMASAWLIRWFIDSKARFGFVTDVTTAGDAIPFDMFGGGFGHEGDRCTFETLTSRCGIRDAAVGRIAEIVHDLDLNDGKFGAPEAATLGVAIEGLQLSLADDDALLEQGMTLFEALYRSFAQSSRPPRPRAVVTRQPKRRRPK